MSAKTMNDKPLEGLRILVVDDETDIRNGLGKLISRLGAVVALAADGLDALDALVEHPADLILTDLMMPRMTGSELLVAVKERNPETEVVMLTGFGTIQIAVSCLQKGAAHFLTKPFDNKDLLTVVERIGRQILARRAPHVDGNGHPEIIAEDPAMESVLKLVDRVAAHPVPVLIEGESGTGKEVIAAAVHARSAVHQKQFLAINAAALSDSLLESELFGHRKGAFTGAERNHPGIFEQANGGTVFLDELCSMSKSFQGKLLRVLEEKAVRPVGADRNVPVDFRLVCATNRDLGELMQAGGFREDLYYRISVMRIKLPPLRERRADIVPLAKRFLGDASRACLDPSAPFPFLSQSVIDCLHRHPWPGNVRELQNCMHRALIICTDGEVQPHHLGLESSAWSPRPESTTADYAASKKFAVEEFQREFVQRALRGSAGNISQAAAECGMTRAALQRILRQLKIDPAPYR